MVQSVQARNTDRSRVLTQAVHEVARRFEFGSTDLKNIIGISQPTASRLLNGKYSLNEGGKEWELSALFVRMYRSLSSMVGGDDELAKVWLNTPNRSFGGQHPSEAIKRIEGLIHACEYLDVYRARI